MAHQVAGEEDRALQHAHQQQVAVAVVARNLHRELAHAPLQILGFDQDLPEQRIGHRCGESSVASGVVRAEQREAARALAHAELLGGGDARHPGDLRVAEEDRHERALRARHAPVREEV